MGVSVSIWDEGKTKQEVSKRYKQCLDHRRYLEDRWVRNERSLYSTTAGLNNPVLTNSLENTFDTGLAGIDNSDVDMQVAYVFKNFRFIHAQMSANPPSVAMRPTSSDQEDRRKADAADRIVRWAIRHYKMQEKVDQQNLNCLTYGTGVLKTVWDSTKGDIVESSEDSEEIKLEGDIAVTVPFIWNIFIDPDAKSIDDIKYVIERVYMDYDEACNKWPDKKEVLEKARVNKEGSFSGTRNSELGNSHYNVVELLEYWETGTPVNGYLGRYCITTVNGEPVEPCRPSPFRFKQAGGISRIEAMDIPDEIKEAKIARLPEQAFLPYHILTDVDIPNMVWGRSFVEYASQLQDNLNRLDTASLDNLAAHSAARLLVPKDSEVTDLGNTTWDVTEIDINQPPYFMSPPQMMPEMTPMRNALITGINDVSGVNESMFGQQSREQSGASMQYATNQGNMIRRRLFNKYVLNVESVYKSILNLVRKHWTINRTINVLGKEKALEAVDLKGADIDGGYDVVGEYGVTLSLDPITRREEIMTLQPLFKEAGIPARKALEMMKLNELEGMYDKLELAGNRQREIFEAMISTGSYIPPKKFRDHANMIAWALDYFMTIEFNSLPEELQQLCEKHIEERGMLAAQETGGATPAGNLPPQAPGPLPGSPAGALPTPAGLPSPITG